MKTGLLTGRCSSLLGSLTPKQDFLSKRPPTIPVSASTASPQRETRSPQLNDFGAKTISKIAWKMSVFTNHPLCYFQGKQGENTPILLSACTLPFSMSNWNQNHSDFPKIGIRYIIRNTWHLSD